MATRAPRQSDATPAPLVKPKKTATLRVRVTPELKEQTEAVLDELGMTVSEVVNMLCRQIVHRGGLPFEPQLPKETLEAIRDIRDRRNLSYYDSIDDMRREFGPKKPKPSASR